MNRTYFDHPHPQPPLDFLFLFLKEVRLDLRGFLYSSTFAVHNAYIRFRDGHLYVTHPNSFYPSSHPLPLLSLHLLVPSYVQNIYLLVSYFLSFILFFKKIIYTLDFSTKIPQNTKTRNPF